MNRRLLLLPTLIGAAVACGVPAAASAATVTRAGDGTLVYTASPGKVDHATVQADDGTGAPVFYTSGDPVTAAPSDCSVTDDGDVVTCPSAPAARLDLGDGDDIGGVSYSVTFPVTVLGGVGSDEIKDNGSAATLDGGDGDDIIAGGDAGDILQGGAGNDHLDGAAGADHLLGGDGNDVLAPDGEERPSPDVVDGGAGLDSIESDWTNRYDQSKPPVTVTLAGGADDGRPGEGDDVRGVESIDTFQASTLVGTDASERFDSYHTTESSTLIGNGGNDELDAGNGSDRLDGGQGDDLLDGGFGDDAIVGGPGRDRIYGDKRGGDCGPVVCYDAFGNDTIDARDGEPDAIDCGAGDDTVQADAIDTVATDCEHIARAGAVAPDPTPTTGPPTAALLVEGHPRLGTALRRGLRVSVGDPTVTVVAQLHGRQVGSGSGSGTVTVRFTRAGRRTLARKGAAKLTLVAGSVHAQVTLKR